MNLSSKRMLAAALAATAALVAPVMAMADMAAAEMIDTSGTVIGKVTFEQTPHGVLMYVEVAGLPPGPHGHSPARRRLLYPGLHGGNRSPQPERGGARPAKSGRPPPWRPAQSVRRRRWLRAGAVLHRPGIRCQRPRAGLVGRGRLGGDHTRESRPPPLPTQSAAPVAASPAASSKPCRRWWPRAGPGAAAGHRAVDSGDRTVQFRTSLPGSPHRRRIRQRSWPAAQPAALVTASPSERPVEPDR